MRLLPSSEEPGADLNRMKSICLPHTELPGTSALFADYLYRFPRLSGFYRHDPHDPESIRKAAREVALPQDRRRRLVSALRRINGGCAAMDLLAQPGTVTVVTGQQVGLFSGPVYTIYKALTAARLARQLSEEGIPAVAVFWLATEDHDLAEVDHGHVFDSRRRPVTLRAAVRGVAGQPAGGVEIAEAPLEQLREAFRGLPYADEIVALAGDCYQPGRTLGDAFRMLLERLLDGFGLVFLDPMQPEIRELAAPLLETALEGDQHLSAALQARGKELKAAGYHAQVLFEEHSSLFFKLEDGRRLPLRRNGAEYFQGARKITKSELAAAPVSLSPSALLRPVMQDYLLPSVAYVGGPAELAYLGQSEVLYRELLGRMPVAVPRSGFTLLDERARSLMDRHGITLPACFHGLDPLKELVAAALVPAALQEAFERASAEVRDATTRLRNVLNSFDPTLGAAMAKSQAKMLYQVEKNQRKAAREALRRDALITESAAYLANLVYPRRVLQERYYSVLPFIAQHGPGLIKTIGEHIHRGCPDHVLLTV